MTSPVRMPITPRELREARLALGLSQAQLARRWGLRVATVRAWDRGAAPIPTMAKLGLLALHREALG